MSKGLALGEGRSTVIPLGSHASPLARRASPGGFEPGSAPFGKPAKAWTFSRIAEQLKQVERASRHALTSLHSPSIARVRGAGGEARGYPASLWVDRPSPLGEVEN